METARNGKVEKRRAPPKTLLCVSGKAAGGNTKQKKNTVTCQTKTNADRHKSTNLLAEQKQCNCEDSRTQSLTEGQGLRVLERQIGNRKL